MRNAKAAAVGAVLLVVVCGNALAEDQVAYRTFDEIQIDGDAAVGRVAELELRPDAIRSSPGGAVLDLKTGDFHVVTLLFRSDTTRKAVLKNLRKGVFTKVKFTVGLITGEEIGGFYISGLGPKKQKK